MEKAIFAGGCFWCMVSPFHVLKGIYSVRSGYIGGVTENPTYEDVKTQSTSHYEAIEVVYNPDEISYEKLLNAFWMQIDPTDDEGQFHDRGSSYRTAIFYTSESQRAKAEASKKALEESKRFSKPIVTEILLATPFYDAEEYHQDFYLKDSKTYKADRNASGRDEFILSHWGEEYWALFDDMRDDA